MPRKHRFESAGLRYLYDRYIGQHAQRRALYEGALAAAEVARRIYDLRAEAGLTQRRLAERVGTTPSVLSRLEDADYKGHSLAMLRRIAAACDQQVEIRFVPRRKRSRIRRAAGRPKAA